MFLSVRKSIKTQEPAKYNIRLQYIIHIHESKAQSKVFLLNLQISSAKKELVRGLLEVL